MASPTQSGNAATEAQSCFKTSRDSWSSTTPAPSRATGMCALSTTSGHHRYLDRTTALVVGDCEAAPDLGQRQLMSEEGAE